MQERKQGGSQSLHTVMYPWYGLSHLTSFLRLSNKLAERGHKVSFFLPTKTQPKLSPQNHHPHLITFFPITVPHVDGLPLGTETPHEVPEWGRPLLWAAMDLTKETIDAHLAQLKPDFIFFDFAYWLPGLARKHGAKSVYYTTSSLVPYTFFRRDNNNGQQRGPPPPNDNITIREVRPPLGFPCQEMMLYAGEVRALLPYSTRTSSQNGAARDEGMSLRERVGVAFKECDAIASKTCKEIEGPFCHYLETRMEKPILLAGPLIPDPPTSTLDHHFDSWFKGFGEGTVIYCALGSECVLTKHQFQELVLGLELTGKPFLAAIRPPTECETIESAMPEGFLERTKGLGMVHGGWVQQPLILQHPSVGCFVTHCGAGSLSEAMLSHCQLVLLPQGVDQFINARMMSMYLKVGVEIEKRDDDCCFTKETVSKAIQMVMEVESEVGKEVRAQHTKWRELLLKEGLEDSYIDEFIQRLQDL